MVCFIVQDKTCELYNLYNSQVFYLGSEQSFAITFSHFIRMNELFDIYIEIGKNNKKGKLYQETLGKNTFDKNKKIMLFIS